MKDRVLSGVTLVAFFMAIVVFNRSFPLALNIAIAFISALAVFEVIKALELSDRWYITVPGMTAAVLVQFCEFQQANIFIYSAFTACIFCALLRHHREITFKEMAVVYSMVVLIPLALQTIVLVRTLSDQHGMFYALVCVFSAWIPDAGAFVSVLGDLSFSLIKRSCHIKDFGSVIPGHGGILDRFDSVIFTAPFVYMVTMLLPIVS